jgi:hypothetical protein
MELAPAFSLRRGEGDPAQFAKQFNILSSIAPRSKMSLPFYRNSAIHKQSRPIRGTIRGRHVSLARDAMDAARRQTCDVMRTAKSCGPDPPMLGSSRATICAATVASKPAHRGEHEAAVNTIARGMPMFGLFLW